MKVFTESVKRRVQRTIVESNRDYGVHVMRDKVHGQPTRYEVWLGVSGDHDVMLTMSDAEARSLAENLLKMFNGAPDVVIAAK